MSKLSFLAQVCSSDLQVQLRPSYPLGPAEGALALQTAALPATVSPAAVLKQGQVGTDVATGQEMSWWPPGVLKVNAPQASAAPRTLKFQ